MICTMNLSKKNIKGGNRMDEGIAYKKKGEN